jgi:hypothetical protein
VTSWLGGFVAAVWPNIAADLLWLPAAALYHRWLRRHLTQVGAAVRQLEEIRAHLHGHDHGD